MKINITTNSIHLGDFVCHINSVLYTKIIESNLVVFDTTVKVQKRAVISQTTVNGVQMTPDNIDQLLAPIFSSQSGDNTSSEQPPNQEEHPALYTKAAWSDPLVFPKPERSGHIVEFYKDDAIEAVYQYTGWDWLKLGFKPTFSYLYKPFSQYETDNLPDITDQLRTVFPYVGIEGDKYTLSAGSQVRAKSTQIQINSFLQNTDSLIVQSLFLKPNELSKQHELLTNIDAKADYGNISIINEDEAQADTKVSATQKVTVSDSLVRRLVCQVADIDLETVNLETTKEGSMYEPSGLYADCSALSVTDSTIAQIGAKIHPLKSDTATVKIQNTSFYRDISISFEAKTYSDSLYRYIREATIDITSNKDYTALSISSKDAETRVENLLLEIPQDSIKSVSMQNICFSEQAVEALLTALSTIEVKSLPFTYKNCLPDLTDDQKIRLIGAGWKVVLQ